MTVMIYLSKSGAPGPRYIAERGRGRRLRWWESATGKVADLQLVEPRNVPRKVQQQIARARYREITKKELDL
jgi:hypothetical protein